MPAGRARLYAACAAEKAGPSQEGRAASVDRRLRPGRPPRPALWTPWPAAVERDGGAVLGRYRDPFGGTPLLLAALPVDRVEPTPYQRDPSDAHVKRLMGVIEKIGLLPRSDHRRFGTTTGYWTPNGNHRLQALKKLGVAHRHRAARARRRRRVQDPRAQHREGAQPAREVARDDPHGARAGRRRATTSRKPASPSSSSSRRSSRSASCYEERPRLSGGAYQSILRRVDEFLDEPIAQGAQGARAARQEDPEAGRRGDAPRSRS